MSFVVEAFRKLDCSLVNHIFTHTILKSIQVVNKRLSLRMYTSFLSFSGFFFFLIICYESLKIRSVNNISLMKSLN